MSGLGILTLTDGASTPVDHTFSPQPNTVLGVVKWVDRSGGIALGYPAATFSLREPTKASRAYKIVAKLVTPVLEVTSPSTSTGIQPAPTLAYNVIMSMECVLPERSTLQQRKDIYAMFKDYISDDVIKNAVWNFEPVY